VFILDHHCIQLKFIHYFFFFCAEMKSGVLSFISLSLVVAFIVFNQVTPSSSASYNAKPQHARYQRKDVSWSQQKQEKQVGRGSVGGSGSSEEASGEDSDSSASDEPHQQPAPVAEQADKEAGIFNKK
jgi:hypothetical protein